MSNPKTFWDHMIPYRTENVDFWCCAYGLGSSVLCFFVFFKEGGGSWENP